MGDPASGYMGLMLVAFFVVFIILVLWILLPFAVFGIKPLITKLIAEVQKTNELLKHRAPGE